MKKFDFPIISITFFQDENVMLASGSVNAPIEEVSALQTLLGDSNAEYRVRIKNFQELISFTQ